METEVIILAAGMGSRLGGAAPKPLTQLSSGETIMEQQLNNIKVFFGEQKKATIVVGYKSDHIIEAHPDQKFVYNTDYDSTNTSKSLLKALEHTPKDRNILWLNGDVVFSEQILLNASSLIGTHRNFVTVNTADVHDEEVKYTVDREGFIDDLSKVVPLTEALGEAVGINYVSAANRELLTHNLRRVGQQDYFEKAIELSIRQGMQVEPYDFTQHGLYAVEVDFAEDLNRANSTLTEWKK